MATKREIALNVEEIFKVIDAIVEASGRPFIKLAWGIIRQWLKPSAVVKQLYERQQSAAK